MTIEWKKSAEITNQTEIELGPMLVQVYDFVPHNGQPASQSLRLTCTVELRADGPTRHAAAKNQLIDVLSSTLALAWTIPDKEQSTITVSLSPSDLAALERHDCDQDDGVYAIGLHEQTQCRRLCEAGLLDWLRADDRGILYRTNDTGRAAYSRT